MARTKGSGHSSIFGSEVRYRLLQIFFGPDFPTIAVCSIPNIRHLLAEYGLIFDNAGLTRQLNELTHIDLLTTVKIGERTNSYLANTAHPLYQSLCSLFHEERKHGALGSDVGGPGLPGMLLLTDREGAS